MVVACLIPVRGFSPLKFSSLCTGSDTVFVRQCQSKPVALFAGYSGIIFCPLNSSSSVLVPFTPRSLCVVVSFCRDVDEMVTNKPPPFLVPWGVRWLFSFERRSERRCLPRTRSPSLITLFPSRLFTHFLSSFPPPSLLLFTLRRLSRFIDRVSRSPWASYAPLPAILGGCSHDHSLGLR